MNKPALIQEVLINSINSRREGGRKEERKDGGRKEGREKGERIGKGGRRERNK